MVQGCQIDEYEALRTEIVRSAVMDLQRAMRKSDRLGFVCNEQIRLERWFLSKWGQALSGDNGEYIIEMCQKSYRNKPHGNGKKQLPDEIQKKIYADYQSGMRKKEICKKYGITSNQCEHIVRRWES